MLDRITSQDGQYAVRTYPPQPQYMPPNVPQGYHPQLYHPQQQIASHQQQIYGNVVRHPNQMPKNFRNLQSTHQPYIPPPQNYQHPPPEKSSVITRETLDSLVEQLTSSSNSHNQPQSSNKTVTSISQDGTYA